MSGSKVTVPDLGDFDEVEVIEVLVQPGDTVEEEQGLITLETEKAAMDVPAPSAGRIEQVLVKVGDKVSAGSEIAVMAAGDGEGDKGGSKEARSDADAGEGAQAGDSGDSGRSQGKTGAASTSGADSSVPKQEQNQKQDSGAQTKSAPAKLPANAEKADHTARLVVLGAGPGGYSAAFRAADLGMDVILVERWPVLGGVCLNVGCIPSKALLHAARVVEEAESFTDHGLKFGKPKLDLRKLHDWQQGVVKRLVGGLAQLARQRKVRVVNGVGRFINANQLAVEGEGGRSVVQFEQCIVAAGSESVWLPGWPDDERIMDSTGALELKDVPKRLLVVGGGIIGLEMGTVYEALGSKVSVVELTGTLMPGADRDLVRPLEKRLKARFESILLNTKVTGAEATDKGIRVSFEGDNAPEPQVYDRVLMSVGRRPNGRAIDADSAGVTVDGRGFIPSDRQLRTNVDHIYAIGDIAGGPMLAHKAVHEGKVAAEVAAGEKSSFDARVIPSVAYTDPEVAWVGVTETEAKEKGIDYEKGSFPWAASGRSLAMGRDEGMTKLLFDPKTHRVIGGGVVGTNAGDLIAEIGLAIEMGADAADIGLTVHPHPTLSETVAMAAEAFEGTLTDLIPPKRKKR